MVATSHLYVTTIVVSNKEYIESMHLNHGHIQLGLLRLMSINRGKWQPTFTSISKDVVAKCLSCQPKHVWSSKPQSTLPRDMDFNEIISVDLKELAPKYRKEGYKYILYIVDKFSKFMKEVLIKNKEAGTVVSAEFTSNIEEEFSTKIGISWKYTASHSPHSNGSCERNQ